MEQYQQEAYIVVALFHVVNVIMMILWYRGVCKKYGTHGITIKQSITIKNIAMVVFLGIALQLIGTGALNMLNILVPGSIDKYAEIAQTAGFTGDNVLSLIAVVFLAAIGEELAFRGVTMIHLNRCGAIFWVANVIQAILFGIEHMNVVQGIFAFVIGAVLGFVSHKYNSIYLAMLLHMVINGTEVIMNHTTFDHRTMSGALITASIGLLVLSVAITIFRKNAPSQAACHENGLEAMSENVFDK